jgi:hypothetical protein
MARLPSRKELADRIEKLERDLSIATAGAGVGAVLARSPAARTAALSGVRAVSPYALAVDALIREEESLLGRGAIGLAESAGSLATGVEAKARREGLPIAGRPAVAPRKKRKTRFNKLVSSGMKTVRASTSMGSKGKISNAKKAFSLVTKAASAVTKGHKLPKSGIKRKIMSVMRRIR